ncbi:hypothetical protein STANM309S_04537 [Streptomyces tanashiensis]
MSRIVRTRGRPSRAEAAASAMESADPRRRATSWPVPIVEVDQSVRSRSSCGTVKSSVKYEVANVQASSAERTKARVRSRAAGTKPVGWDRTCRARRAAVSTEAASAGRG